MSAEQHNTCGSKSISVTKPKPYQSETMAARRIRKCMARLTEEDDIKSYIKDLKKENDRLRKEGENLRNVTNAYKNELEAFRAEFAEYRRQKLMPGTDESEKMEEN